MATSPLRALLYQRVSDDPSGRAVSVKSQEAENRTFCEQQGWLVVGSVTDNDRSASRHAVKEREGYREVRRALTGKTAVGRVDVLVCWEASRAHRDLGDHVQLRDLCATEQVLLAYKGRVYDLTTGDDRFATGMDALIAEREAEMIQERVMRGVRARAAVGAPHGTVPFGYRRDYDPRNGALLGQVPDETTAPVVREIVRRVIAGESLHGIARDLTARGVPTPQAYKDALRGDKVERAGWTSAKMRSLLASRSIIGVRTHRGEQHPEPTWEGLVPVGDFELVRTILAEPGRAAHHRGVELKHLLSGIAECGPCGAWLRAASNRGRPVYQCAGHGDGRGKGHVSRPREPLEDVVIFLARRRLADPALMGAAERTRGDHTATVAARELASLQAQLAELEEEAVQGRISPGAFGRIEAGLLARIEQARLAAVPRGVPSVVRDLVGRPDGWGQLLLPQRRLVVRTLMRVVVHRSVRTPGSRGFDDRSVETIWVF